MAGSRSVSKSAALICRSWTSWTNWRETNTWASATPREYRQHFTAVTLSHIAVTPSWVIKLASPLCTLCPSFQSERESGDRNFAIGYYLKEKKVKVVEIDQYSCFYRRTDCWWNAALVCLQPSWCCSCPCSVFQRGRTWPPSWTSTSR